MALGYCQGVSFKSCPAGERRRETQLGRDSLLLALQRLVAALAVLVKARSLCHGIVLTTASAARGKGTALSSGNDNVGQEFEGTSGNRKEDWDVQKTTESVRRI